MTHAARLSILKENLKGLRLAVASLSRSRDLCAGLDPLRMQFDENQLDRIEVLASRFARTTDYLCNKTLRSLDHYEGYPQGSPLDVTHRADKRGIVGSTQLRTLKDLRNEIAHEYLAEEISELLSALLLHTPALIAAANASIGYAEMLTGAADITPSS
jgi:hypothetical protein